MTPDEERAARLAASKQDIDRMLVENFGGDPAEAGKPFKYRGAAYPPELEEHAAAHMAAGMDEATARSKAVADHIKGLLHGPPPPTTPPPFPFAGPTVSSGLPPVPPRGMSARGKGLAIGGGIAAATALGAGAYHALKGDDERTAAYVEGSQNALRALGLAKTAAVLLPALGGAALGAAGGAFLSPEESRLRGAALGAATGGLMGGATTALTGGLVGSAVGGVVPWLEHDKADTAQYLASPEYQAFLRSQGE